MSHRPQHPENPYNLPEQQQAAAKVWELLRRNDRFRRLTCGLQRLDHRARKEERPPSSAAWNAAYRLVRGWRDRHDFAGVALQWLVPEPLFAVRRWRLPRDLDLRGTGVVRPQGGARTARPRCIRGWHTWEADTGWQARMSPYRANAGTTSLATSSAAVPPTGDPSAKSAAPKEPVRHSPRESPGEESDLCTGIA